MKREANALFQSNFLLEPQDRRCHFPCSGLVEFLLVGNFEILSMRKNTVKMTASAVNSYPEKKECISMVISLV
jgi:hypothetical protein